jgi:hypothetical protein
MPNRARTIFWILCAVPLLSLLVSPARNLSQEIQHVLVDNFPETQKVTGSVSVDGTIRHGVPQRFQDFSVSPAKRSEVRRLTAGGTINTEGFTSMVVGLAGEFKSVVPNFGTVGAILLPDEAPILRAFDDDGTLEFQQEITAQADSRVSAYFASEPKRLAVGFTRYRIYFYNTTERSVGVNLYVYLTN